MKLESNRAPEVERLLQRLKLELVPAVPKVDNDLIQKMAEAVRSNPVDIHIKRSVRPIGRSNALRRRKTLAAVSSLLLIFSSLAIAGALPDLVQEAAADVADTVGVDGVVPHPGGAEADAPQSATDSDVVRDAATNPESTGVDKARQVTESATGEDQVPQVVSTSSPESPAETGARIADHRSGGDSEEGTSMGEEASTRGAANADRRGPP